MHVCWRLWVVRAALCLCAITLAAQNSGQWLDVPFIKQEKDGCGAASIAMVMQYWQKQPGASQEGSDPADIQRALYTSQAHGIYASDMERYLREHGFRTYSFRGAWDDLKQHVAKGRPLIVALKPLPAEKVRHYVVVVGVDWQQSVVFVNDAAQRKLLKMDRTAFVKEWNAVGNWTLLAVPEPPK